MIDSKDYIKQKGIYLKDGKLWRVLSYCSEPSIEMLCMVSGERMSFGIGGLCNSYFTKINELTFNHETCKVEKVNDNN